MKKFIINILYFGLTLTLCSANSPRVKDFSKFTGTEFVPSETKAMTVSGEPSCEELRAMWRFSRRQSRAAEITNEIPTYRDPFAYNVWEQYPRARSVVGNLRSNGRPWSRPIYGRIIQNAPNHHPRVQNFENTKAYEEVLRYLDNPKTDFESRRKMQLQTVRLPGGSLTPSRVPQSGSFQHLKKLIWEERAKELQQQRLLEEAAARTAALKDVHVPTHFNNKPSYPEQNPNVNSNKNNNNYNNNNYMYNLDQDINKNSRIKYFNGDQYNTGMVYSQDPLYRKPYRQRSMFNSESSYDPLW